MTYKGSLLRLALLTACYMMLVTAACSLFLLEQTDPGPSLPRRTHPAEVQP